MAVQAAEARKILLSWTILIIAVSWFAVPLFRPGSVVLLQPSYHPEYYHGMTFPFTGYLYPSLLLGLLAGALSPYLVPTHRFPTSVQQQLKRLSLFAVCLLSLLALIYVVWVVVTPIF